MNTSRQPHTVSLLAAVAAAAVMLGACSRSDDATVGERVDGAVAQAEQKLDQAGAEAREKMDQARVATERAAEQAKDKMAGAAEAVSNTVADAAVTASVNAELAKDPKLSALQINVDTTNGHVRLSGKAPDADSRERATRLASAVKGVTHVENRLEVGG